jgi:diguanylate cyclase (GGDEF)-like protein/PAS domain S-box-containing protein
MRNLAEANLSALIESTEDLIWSVDLEYRLIEFNSALRQSMEATFGVQLVVGMPLESSLPPERAALWPPLYERVRTEGPFRVEYSLVNGCILDLSFNPIVVDGETTGVSVFGKDITERKRTEEALRESLDSLSESQRGGGLGSYILDFRTEVWGSSDVMDEIFGIDKDYERTLEGWIALIHPDDRAKMTAYFADEVVGERKAFDKEYRILRQTDAAERWVHGMGRLEFDAQGKPLKMRGVIKDITDSKRSEILLRDSEERYRETFEQAAVGIVHTSFDGSFLRWNARFAEIIGYPHEEISGLTFQRITVPEDLAESIGLLEQIPSVPTGDVIWEKRYIRKDGSLTWVKITVSTQRDAEGQRLHYIAVVEDISARKIAEESLAAAQEALRASEERYRTAFQTSLDGICISHLDDGRYIDANKAFFDLMGFEREEVIGRTSLELNLWADSGDRQAITEELRRNSRLRDTKTRFRRKSGELFWVLISVSVIEIEGVSCILSVVKDISEAAAAEERLAAAQEAQRGSEARYRTAFHTNPNAVSLSRLDDGAYSDVNETFLDLMEFDRDEVIGRTSQELNIWADPCDRENIIEALRQSSVFRGEVQFRTKSGRILWGRMSASLFEHEGIACVLSVTQDITETKAASEHLAEAQAALLKSEERYRAAFQTSLDSVNINRLNDGMFVECNKAFLDVTGYKRDEVLGRTSLELSIWADPRDRKNLTEILRQHSACRDVEARFRKKSGELFWGLISASLVELDGVQCVLSVTRDISDAKAAENEIRNLAFYDPLTSLPNRRLLMDRLRQVLAASAHDHHMHALLFIDLDHFKTLNDTLGHQTGDLQLQEVARRLAACVREADTVSRLGGDEFVVMLEDLAETAEDAAEAAKTGAEKILAAVAQPYLIGGRECRTTASIGITVFGDRKEEADEVLQQADIAMDQAKAAGCNTVRFFSPALQTAVNARAALEDDLRQAIKTNQFALYYQPQVESTHLIGAEALIRWNHPVRGLLPPGDFIPLAEETGLILPLGDLVLETACNQIAAWAHQEAPAYISVSVNISALQFRQPDFVQKVLAALDRSGADPQNLELELTESMLADNIEEVIAKMTELKSHGLRFSLDDFGTGYSSLTYLKRLPLDQLKIDRSFVRDILVDATSGAIAQTIVSLSRAMGLPVIAEGVETEEQRDFLTRLGCHAFQGYLFSRPLALEEFERLWVGPSEYTAPVPTNNGNPFSGLNVRRDPSLA